MRHAEAPTASGQLIRFSCPPEMVDRVKQALQDIRSIDIPVTGRVNIAHGGYGRYTRYNIVQHKYAGGGGPGNGTLIEVLEVVDPPDDRGSFILLWEVATPYEDEGYFAEFKSLESAIVAFDKLWASGDWSKKVPKEPGFCRLVRYGWRTPWFYAVGQQLLEGDTVFADNVPNNSIYRYGDHYIFESPYTLPIIRTCLGGRIILAENRRSNSYYSHEQPKDDLQIAYFDDGTVWKSGDFPIPKRVTSDQLWIVEAIDKFKRFLAGGILGFTIDFSDGGQFVGRLKTKADKTHHRSGRYLIEGKTTIGKSFKGEVDFAPTSEVPTLDSWLASWAKKKGVEIAEVTIIRQKTRTISGQRAWEGVYQLPDQT